MISPGKMGVFLEAEIKIRGISEVRVESHGGETERVKDEVLVLRQ